MLFQGKRKPRFWMQGMILAAEMCIDMKTSKMLSRWAESRVISFVRIILKQCTVKHMLRNIYSFYFNAQVEIFL
jgi:hypothetical protein